MDRFTRRLPVCLIAVLLVLALTAATGGWLHRSIIGSRQREAENILFYYSEKILLQMQGTMNEAGALAKTAYAMEKGQADPSDWFEHAAGPLA